MIVPAPVTPLSSPPASAGGSEPTVPSEAGSGGFLETLMELITGAEPEAEALAAGAATIDLLLDVTEDGTVDTAEGLPIPTPPAAIMVPGLQPAEIRAAQAMAHAGNAEAPVVAGQGAGGAPAPSTALTMVPSEGPGLTAIDATPLATLSEIPAPSVSGLPQVTTQEGIAAARTSPAEAPVPRQLHTQVGTPAWNDELGTQLHMMADKGQHTASLRLSPEHLGPLEVQISVKDDKATVWFGSANVDTRAAIEQAMPRLRELFAAQGMSLDQSGVFQNSRQGAERVHRPAEADGRSPAEDAGPATAVAVRRGLIDAYA